MTFTFNRLANALRRNFPTNKKVYIRRCKTPRGSSGKPLLGRCIDHGDKWEILVSDKKCAVCQSKTLLHEYAHVLSGWYKDDEQHHDEWGMAYAKLLRWYYAQ